MTSLFSLIRHQKIAIDLLVGPEEEVGRFIAKAKAKVEVDRWEQLGSCSPEVILRWRNLLALSSREFAVDICSDLDGWGVALRQNSAWKVASL